LASRTEIGDLLRWDTGLQIAEESYSRLRVHPRYTEAVRTYASNMLAIGDADPLLDGIMKDAGRNSAAMFAAYLHFSGGLTLPSIKALCASLGLVSIGRARALLLYLRYLGYVEPAPATGGRGPARYRATAKFIHTWRSMQRRVMESVAVVEPAIGLLADHIDTPGVLDGFTRFQCEGFLATAPHVDRNSPYFRVFMHSNAGFQIVHTLLAANEGDFPPTAQIPFSISAAAKRFRVSRVHVSRVLAAAQQLGLLRLCADGAICFEPEGRSAVDFIFAMQLVHFLSAAAKTLKALPELPEMPVSLPAHIPMKPDQIGEAAC